MSEGNWECGFQQRKSLGVQKDTATGDRQNSVDQEFFGDHLLAQIAVSTRGKRVQTALHIFRSCQHQDGWRASPARNLLDCCQTGEAGQAQVHQHHIRLQTLNEPNRRFAGRDSTDDFDPSFCPQKKRDRASEEVVIFNN